MTIGDDKIKEAEEIDKIRESRKNLEDAVKAIPEIQENFKQLREELCVGPDCLKKKVEDKFEAIDEKIKKIEEKTGEFLCDNCGFTGVKPLSSFCSNCGSPIYQWDGNDGKPVEGWKHYSERNK